MDILYCQRPDPDCNPIAKKNPPCGGLSHDLTPFEHFDFSHKPPTELIVIRMIWIVTNRQH